MSLFLDTHVLLWWVSKDGRLSATQRRAISRESKRGPLLVAGITLWEIAMLNDLGRIRLDLPLREWLTRAVAPPLVQLVNLSPAIAAEVAALPADFHRDPADRIIVASARVFGATLLTQDKRIVGSTLVRTVS
jgi:PIN domain nuclease of toxin-antitoxin system